MTELQEVIASPMTVLLRAYTGTLPTVPAIDDAQSDLITSGWELLGARGQDSIKREGVMVESTQEFAEFMGANSIKHSDRWRVSEMARVSCSVVDLRMETLARAMDQDVTEVTSGTPHYKEIGLGRPRAVRRWSVLLRGLSPQALESDTDRYRQFLLWNCQVTSPYSEQPNRDTPGEVPFEFKPVAVLSQDEEKKFGIIRAWSGT